jgi:microcompartment protein CcmL/EutN
MFGLLTLVGAAVLANQAKKKGRKAGEGANQVFEEHTLPEVQKQIDRVDEISSKLIEESEAVRSMANDFNRSFSEAQSAFTQSAYSSCMFTFAAGIFGRIARKATEQFGYDEDTQNKVEFAISSIVGATASVASKAVKATPFGIAGRLISYLALPALKRGLTAAKVPPEKAMAAAITAKTLIDIYTSPVKGMSVALGLFLGSAAGEVMAEVTTLAASGLHSVASSAVRPN